MAYECCGYGLFAIAIAIYLKNTNNKYFYYLEMSLIIISVVLFNQSLQQRFYSTQGSFDDTCVLGAGEWLPGEQIQVCLQILPM